MWIMRYGNLCNKKVLLDSQQTIYALIVYDPNCVSDMIIWQLWIFRIVNSCFHTISCFEHNNWCFQQIDDKYRHVPWTSFFPSQSLKYQHTESNSDTIQFKVHTHTFTHSDPHKIEMVKLISHSKLEFNLNPGVWAHFSLRVHTQLSSINKWMYMWSILIQMATMKSYDQRVTTASCMHILHESKFEIIFWILIVEKMLGENFDCLPISTLVEFEWRRRWR